MFTREEFLKAWKILFDKKQIDVRGFNNMNKVLKFLDKEFDKAYDPESIILSKQDESKRSTKNYWIYDPDIKNAWAQLQPAGLGM